MIELGSAPPLVINTAPAVASPAPVAVKPAASFVQQEDSVPYDAQQAEQQRLQAVQSASQAVADVFVVSDRTFTIFKDSSGQYITRFTSLRDGKVTYIPEPNLFRLGGESERSSVKIRV